MSAYSNEAKRAWRRTAWDTFIRLAPKQPRVLMVDTGSGFEVLEAVERGVPQDLIVVVNKSAAHVAAIKRRFPKTTAIGVDLERACSSRVDGMFDIVSADLCSPLNCAAMMDAVWWAWSRCRCVFGVTMLAGRDASLLRTHDAGGWRSYDHRNLMDALSIECLPANVTMSLSEHSDHARYRSNYNNMRLEAVACTIGFPRYRRLECVPECVGKLAYRSNKSPMLWSAWRAIPRVTARSEAA